MLNGRENHHRSRLRLYHRSRSSIHRHHLIHKPLPMTTPTMTRSTLTILPLLGNDVGNRLFARTERVTEGVRFHGWTKIAHPTNGNLVLLVIIRRRRRQQLPWRGGWLFRNSRPPRQTRHEHLLYESCRKRSQGLFWRANARGRLRFWTI